MLIVQHALAVHPTYPLKSINSNNESILSRRFASTVLGYWKISSITAVTLANSAVQQVIPSNFIAGDDIDCYSDSPNNKHYHDTPVLLEENERLRKENA